MDAEETFTQLCSQNESFYFFIFSVLNLSVWIQPVFLEEAIV